MKTKLILLFTLVTFITCGQSSPAEKTVGKIDDVNISIEYSSPRAKGRTIYGGLVPYGEIWRAGANKNTTIEFSSDVKIEGQALAKGKYGFFIIPEENGTWTAIFSKKNDAWGSNSYSEADDALRIPVDASYLKEAKENLAYKIHKNTVKFEWADKSFKMKVSK
jgi:hypothetical protein